MTDYNSLLPSNATNAERSLVNVLGPVVDIGNDIRHLWNPATIPAPFLPWLAYSLSVDEWNDGWSDAQKRAVIAASAEVHRRKGTIGAVRRAVAALGYAGVEIVEGVAPRHHNAVLVRNGGETYGHRHGWALFRVRLDLGDALGWSAAQADAMRRVIERAKNARSHLYAIGIAANLTQTRNQPAEADWHGRAGLALTERRTGIRDGTHRRADRLAYVRDGQWQYDGTVPRTGQPVWSGLRFGLAASRPVLSLHFGLETDRPAAVPRNGTIRFDGTDQRGERLAYGRLAFRVRQYELLPAPPRDGRATYDGTVRRGAAREWSRDSMEMVL